MDDRLIDRFGRVATDLRVSLTDKCNLRCSYCMPAEGLDWMADERLLSDVEVIRLVQVAVERLGVQEVRFTGGEPLLRKGLEKIIEAAAALSSSSGAPVQTMLTTNALGLTRRAQLLVVLNRDGADRGGEHDGGAPALELPDELAVASGSRDGDDIARELGGHRPILADRGAC